VIGPASQCRWREPTGSSECRISRGSQSRRRASSAAVAGQPGAARRVAELGVDGPSAGGEVGDLLPATGAGPGQRRKVAGVAAGEVAGRALGGAEQRSWPGAGADPVLLADHAGYVLAEPVVAGGRDGVPPMAGHAGGGGQPEQVRIGHLVPGAGIGGECEAVSEGRLAARLATVGERLQADAPHMERPGADLIAFYLSADRLPAARQWSRKHAHT
jgi:hypothetical protein